MSKKLEGLYPIGVVSEMTGVNTVTLRAWERRHGLLVPQRTSTGRRVYTQADVDAIKEVVALTKKGIPIGQMKQALRMQERTPEAFVEQAIGIWQKSLDNMIEAIVNFDEPRLESIYNEILSLYPIDLVTERLLLPLLRKLGARWAGWSGEKSKEAIAEEHFFSVYLRNKLGARFHHRPANNLGQTEQILLAACLPEEQHEIGLLLFALSAQDKGYRVILLGANMPLNGLAVAAQRSRANAIILSGSAAPDDDLLTALSELTDQLKIPVFIGGHTTHNHHVHYAESGAIPTGSNLADGLHQIGNHLAPRRRRH